MKIFGIVFLLCFLTALSAPAPAQAGNYGYGCYTEAQAQTAIVRHVDGTFWSLDSSIQYEKGSLVDRYSPTGYSNYYYPLPFVPRTSALAGYSPLAQQGNTVYGYQSTETATYGTPSYNQAAAPYQPDYSQFLNQAGRLVEQSQSISAQSYNGFLASATYANAQALELAKINATKDAAVAALNAAKGPSPEAVQRTVTLTLKSDAQGKLAVTQATPGEAQAALPAAAADPTNKFIAAVAANCAGCHGGDSKNALARKALRLEEFQSWQASDFGQIADSVTSGKMPKGKPPLSHGDQAALSQMADWVEHGGKPLAPVAEGAPQ